MFGPLDAALLVPTSDVCEVWRPRSHWLHHPSRWWRIACELARNISMKACKLFFLSPRWDDMILHDIWPYVAKTFSGHWSKLLKSRTVTTKSTNDINQFFLENYINVVGVNASVGARWFGVQVQCTWTSSRIFPATVASPTWEPYSKNFVVKKWMEKVVLLWLSRSLFAEIAQGKGATEAGWHSS